MMIFILFSSPLYAQHQEKIDSLKSIIESNVGIDKFDPMISLVRVYGTFDNRKALEYSQQARQIAFQHSDSARIVTSSRIVGQLYNRLSMYKEAEKILFTTSSIARRNNFRNDYKIILNNLAIAYTYQAKYAVALEIYFQALFLYEEDKGYPDMSLVLNNIGIVYFKLKNYEKALEFYKRSYDLKKQINDHQDLDRLFINTGLCYNQLLDYAKGLEYFELGFKECGNDCRDEIRVEGEFGKGVSHFNLRNYSEAEKHFNESLGIAKKIGYNRFQAENLIYLSHIYILQEKIDDALRALNLCEQISTQAGFNEILVDTYKDFSLIYNKKENYEKASYYQDKYITIKDSIISVAVIDKLAKIQTNYAERENIKTIQAKEETIQRQRSLNFAIILIAILASLLIFVLYRSNRVKKKVNQALSDAKAIIEDQNRQLLSSNYDLDKELKIKNLELEKANESLSRVNEELDNFIYKTSHDIRGPLASLKGMCNVALMDVKDHLALNYLKKLDITAEKLNTILTRLLIVNQINNSVLGSDKIDFEDIVNDVLQLEKKKGLPPRLKIRKQIDTSIEFHSDREFVRIILENLIDNAIKFYNDSERVEPFVDISITEDGQHVKIKVIDNGIGISEVHPDKIFQMFSRASERSETGGIGLYITKTAAEKLGGAVHLKTSPEGYTEFFVMLPLAPAKVLA